MDTKDKARSSTAVSLFVPRVAPVIERTSPTALVEWKRRRKEYEQEVAVRCCHDPEKIATMTTDIRSSFEPSLLEVLCDLEWGIDKAELTNDLLLGKIDSILAALKNNAVPNAAAEFKAAVRMNLQESDVRERVIQFFRPGRQVIEEHGWCEFFLDHEGLKLKCKLFVASIEPQALREEIEAILAYQNRAARSDEKVLFKIILEKALEHERDFRRRKRQRESTRAEGKGEIAREADRPKKKLRVKEGHVAKTEPPHNAATRGKSSKPSQPEKQRLVSGTPEGGCLKCKGDHWLVRCPVTTHEEKTSLLRQQHERRNRDKDERKKTVQARRLKRIKECLPGPVKRVELNGEHSMTYCADSGAGISVISKARLAELMTKDSVVRPVELNEEVDVKTAGGHFLRAKAYVEVKLQINTAAGPVCLTTPVKCLIIDEEEDEFIIGKDVLATLGIGVDRQLEQLVMYGFIDDEYPIDCDDDVEIGVECDADVRAAVGGSLLHRRMLISHCGPQGHRGRHAMMTQLANVFSIERLRVHVDHFLAKYLLCTHVKGGKIIPRPWGETYRSQNAERSSSF